MKKFNLLKTLAVLAVCCIGGGTFAFGSNVTAKAADVTTTDMIVMNGAYIRLQQEGETEETSTAGIRFETLVQKDTWQDAGITEAGMILLPESVSVVDSNFSIDTQSAWKEIVYGGETNRDGRTEVTRGGVEYYAFRVYLYGIPEEAYTSGIQVRAYAIAGGETYYTKDISNNSIAKVASAALRNTIEADEATGDYIYEITEGVWSPYDADERAEMQAYLVNAENPTLTSSKALPEKAHYGDTIDLSGFSATDWLGEAVEISYAVTVNGNSVEVENNAFTIDAYADYTCVVTATDADGRTTSQTYTISVYEESFACSFAPQYHFIKTCEDVEIAGKTVHALGVQMKNKYNYANAGFDKEVDWANNYVSFKVYNPTSYTVVFDLWATKAVTEYTTTNWSGQYVLLKSISLAAGATQEIAITDWYDFETYPYLAIYMAAANNGGASSAQHIGTKIYIYDCTITAEERQDPTSAADYRYATTTATNGFTVATNENKAYIKEGIYSLGIKFAANWPTAIGIDEMKNEKLSNADKISFSVYNATTVNVPLVFSLGTNSRIIEMVAGQWTDVAFDVAGWALKDGDYLTIYSNGDYWYTVDGNKTALHDKVKANYFYFDNFKITEIAEGVTVDTTSEDYLWANGTASSQSTCAVNENSAYCVEGSAYSWAIQATANYPTTINEYSKTIDWSKVSLISFKVYNATEYQLTYIFRLRNADNTANLKSITKTLAPGWNDCELDLSSATGRATGCFFGTYAEWGSNKTLDGTTYTNAYNPIWYAVKTQGIYLDGFTLTYTE